LMPTNVSHKRRASLRNSRNRNRNPVLRSPHGVVPDVISVHGHGIAMTAYSATGSANVLVPLGGTTPVGSTIFMLSDIWSDSHLFGLASLYTEWKLKSIRIEYAAHFAAVFSGTTSSDPGSFVMGIDPDPASAITPSYGRIAALASSVVSPGCVTARRPVLDYIPKNADWLATTRVGETTAAATRLVGAGRLFALWAATQSVGLGSVGDFIITYNVVFRGPTYSYTVNIPESKSQLVDDYVPIVSQSLVCNRRSTSGVQSVRKDFEKRP